MTIPAGSTSATVLIDLLADDLPEFVESFRLHLDSVVAVTSGTELFIGNGTADGSIGPLAPAVVGSTDMAALGSTDPAGIAYVPGQGFFVSDSEVEETPFLRTTNLWKLQPDGNLIGIIQPLEFHR